MFLSGQHSGPWILVHGLAIRVWFGPYDQRTRIGLEKCYESQAKKISQNDSGLSSFNAGNVNDHCGDDESIFGTFPRRSKGSKVTGTKTPLGKLDLDEGKHYKELNYLQEQAKKLIDFDQDLTLDQEMIHLTFWCWWHYVSDCHQKDSHWFIRR